MADTESSTQTTATTSSSTTTSGGTTTTTNNSSTNTTNTSSGGTSTNGNTDTTSTTPSSTSSQTVQTQSPSTGGSTPLPIFVQSQTIECNVGSQISVPAQTTNASGKLTWTVEGTLPNGLTLDSNTGLLYGVVQSQPYQDIVSVDVSSDSGATGSGEYSIVINPQLSLKVESTESQPFVRTVGYSVNVQVTGTGGSGQYQYSLSNAPAGIIIGALTGTISGAFNTEGTQNLNVVVDDGISTYMQSIAFDIVRDPNASTGVTTPNFTRRRLADIGLAKLETAISLRSETPPEYINSAADLLDATRKLCADPTTEFLNAYVAMHQNYGGSFMMEDSFFQGMDDFDVSSYNFMAVIYNAFRQIVWYNNPGSVDFNKLLMVTRSQVITQYLYNYSPV